MNVSWSGRRRWGKDLRFGDAVHKLLALNELFSLDGNDEVQHSGMINKLL
jgi:hypothetical protein